MTTILLAGSTEKQGHSFRQMPRLCIILQTAQDVLLMKQGFQARHLLSSPAVLAGLLPDPVTVSNILYFGFYLHWASRELGLNVLKAYQHLKRSPSEKVKAN